MNMSARPSDGEFFEWVENDQNNFKVQSSLSAYSDLIYIKNSVSFNHSYFSYYYFRFNTDGLMCK